VLARIFGGACEDVDSAEQAQMARMAVNRTSFLIVLGVRGRLIQAHTSCNFDKMVKNVLLSAN
jgi:hypothetical protein